MGKAGKGTGSFGELLVTDCGTNLTIVPVEPYLTTKAVRR